MTMRLLQDSIASFSSGGHDYVVTANEGDARENEQEDANGEDVIVYTEETRLGKIGTTCANNDYLVQDSVLGRLKVTTEFPAVLVDGKIRCVLVRIREITPGHAHVPLTMFHIM